MCMSSSFVILYMVKNMWTYWFLFKTFQTQPAILPPGQKMAVMTFWNGSEHSRQFSLFCIQKVHKLHIHISQSFKINTLKNNEI